MKQEYDRRQTTVLKMEIVMCQFQSEKKGKSSWCIINRFSALLIGDTLPIRFQPPHHHTHFAGIFTQVSLVDHWRVVRPRDIHSF
jgi:hypothetical protein